MCQTSLDALRGYCCAFLAVLSLGLRADPRRASVQASSAEEKIWSALRLRQTERVQGLLATVPAREEQLERKSRQERSAGLFS